MLIKHGWNEELAKDKFLSDSNYIRRTFNFSLEEGEKRVKALLSSQKVTCFGCYDDVTIRDTVIMNECGHSLCKDCFGEYLKEKFKGGPECVYTTCSDHTCGMIIPAGLFKKFLSKTDYAKYENYVLKSFVELSSKTKWCPGKDCDKACESKYEEQIDVQCGCGTEFCFSCTKEAHKPINCD